jgi:hypothetical protein
MKEYLPFWWSMESDSDVKIVSDCSQSENGKTNIVNGSDAEDNPICHFEMRNGLGETSRFSRPCFEKTNLKQYPLFQSFFNTRPVSDGDYSDIYNSSTLG